MSAADTITQVPVTENAADPTVSPPTDDAAASAPAADDACGSPDAQQRAAAILEVLAGLRGPSEAAAALGISVHHYYVLERKGLRGLVTACEVQPKGPRGPGLDQQVVSLQRELDACRQECLRQAALVRVTQRAVGLPALAATDAPSGAAQQRASGKRSGKASGQAPRAKPTKGNSSSAARRRRRPTVRALRAAQALREAGDRAEKNSSGTLARAGLKPRGAPAVQPTARGTVGSQKPGHDDPA
jgi:hypothetical protein